MFKLVLSDMDSTLVPLGAPHVSANTLVAIRALQAEGIEFAPATGRGPVELSPFFLNDHRYIRTGIMSNGKKVYLNGRVVDAHYFDLDDLRRLDAIVHEVPDTFIIVYPDVTRPGNPVWCVNVPESQVASIGKLALRYRFTPRSAREVPDVRIIGCVIASAASQEDLDRVKGMVAHEIVGLDVVQPYPGWCDVLPHGVNKASGLEVLIDKLGIGRDEVVMFGDGENDVALLSAVPNGCAVANAAPVAKAAARWQVGACEDDGVAIAMEQIAQAAHTGTTPAFMRG